MRRPAVPSVTGVVAVVAAVAVGWPQSSGAPRHVDECNVADHTCTSQSLCEVHYGVRCHDEGDGLFIPETP